MNLNNNKHEIHPSSIHHPSIHHNNNFKYNVFIDIHLKLTAELLEDIDRFCNVLKKQNRSQGIREILKIGLFTFSKWNEIKAHPEILDELHAQFKEGGAVDFVEGLGQREFEILFSIFETEHKARH